ncbi:MAG: porin family protein, partial [Gammaproteobacteria bacterium]|nr:porin family protein [Gammaproteobacteria bacterium]
MKLSPTANIYGLIGFSKGEIELSTFAGSVTEDDSGLSFGFGVDTEMSKGMYIGGRFVSYIDDDADYSGININITKYLD